MTAKALEESIILVTGATRGIGHALACGFARDGATVIAVGRDADGLKRASEAARSFGKRLECEIADLARSEDLERLFSAVTDRHGRVDVLINNAALYPKNRFLDVSFADWSRSIQVNLLGLAHCCRLALPLMQKNGYGRILNVGSFAWKGVDVGSSDYCASKAAVAAFTKAIALEVDRDTHPNILVNEFIPGIIKTGMSDRGDDPETVYPHARQVVLRPATGPNGATFLRSELFQEYRPSLLGRLRRAVLKTIGGRSD